MRVVTLTYARFCCQILKRFIAPRGDTVMSRIYHNLMQELCRHGYMRASGAFWQYDEFPPYYDKFPPSLWLISPSKKARSIFELMCNFSLLYTRFQKHRRSLNPYNAFLGLAAQKSIEREKMTTTVLLNPLALSNCQSLYVVNWEQILIAHLCYQS